MKIAVDHSRCMNVGLCVLTAPELFVSSPGGRKAQPISNQVPPALEDLARRTAKSCPSGAIHIR
jgi:ferredoxin